MAATPAAAVKQMLQEKPVPECEAGRFEASPRQHGPGSVTDVAAASPAPPVSTSSVRKPDGLSARLRSETRAEHLAVEHRTSWPDSIRTLDDYRRCLRGLLAIWAPLEKASPARSAWSTFPIACSLQERVPLLERDLRMLGDELPLSDTPVFRLPQSEPEWIGALYVLEGSALGGRVIRADLVARLGSEIADATHFYSGPSAGSHPLWRDVLLAIDAYGSAHPDQQNAVVEGARQTFMTFLDTFSQNVCKVAAA